MTKLEADQEVYRQLFPSHAGKYKPMAIKVTAPAGTTLDFICSVHPWMQAVLHVR